MLRRDALVQQLYVNYKSKLIQMTRGPLLDFHQEESELENNDKHLICKKTAKENVKLGDRVKIKLKKRQLKQKQQDEWNDLITKDIGKIGTVIHILPDGSNEPIVYFPDTGRSWLIQPSALCNVSEEFKSDGSKEAANLKVGDYVDIGYGKNVVERIQGSKSNPWQQIILFQDFLGKILSFEANGYAYVSVGDKLSLLINPTILKRRQSNSSRKADLERPMNIQPTEMQKKYHLHCDVQIKNDLEVFVKQPFWKYQLTQIVGAKGKVTYHGILGEVGITIKEQTWILPYMMLEKKKRTRYNSVSPYVNKEYPFAVNDLVLFKFAFTSSFDRTLNELRLPKGFAEVCRGLAKFLGYTSPTNGMVELDGNRIQVSISELWPSSILKNPKDDLFKAAELRHEKLRVGDDVQFNTGPKTLARHVFHDLNIPVILQKIYLSPAKLEAFDDDKDLALLRYADSKCFWVDPSFITCPDDTTDVTNFLKTIKLPELSDSTDNAPDNESITFPVANITEALDFVEQVKNILQSVKIEFHKPVLYFGRILVATITIQVQSGDKIITEICNTIESSLNCKVNEKESQLVFTNLEISAAIRINFAETDLVNHDDIASVQQEELPAIPIIEDTLLEHSDETGQETEILGVPDGDQHENMDHLLPLDGALHQNKTSIECNGPNQGSNEPENKNILQTLFRQSSQVKEKFRLNSTYNFYSCNFDHSNLGGSA